MKQVSLETVTQGYVLVTFSNGPRNLLDADTITELSEVVDRLGH
jgi:enoyl-CoA hydratase/carnithine racemase